MGALESTIASPVLLLSCPSVYTCRTNRVTILLTSVSTEGGVTSWMRALAHAAAHRGGGTGNEGVRLCYTASSPGDATPVLGSAPGGTYLLAPWRVS